MILRTILRTRLGGCLRQLWRWHFSRWESEMNTRSHGAICSGRSAARLIRTSDGRVSIIAAKKCG